MTPPPIVYMLLVIFCGVSAIALIESTKHTRGPGSWTEDRHRLMVAGGLITISIIFYGLYVANTIAP